MIINSIPFPFFLIFIFLHFQAHTLILAFSPPPASNHLNSSSPILQDLLRVIVAGKGWNLERSRVSELDLGNARFGTARGYEFRIQFGNNSVEDVEIMFMDKVASWNNYEERGSGLEDLVAQLSPLTVLDTFKLKGPFELRVDGDHKLSLSLPLNTSHTGLKRILVGEGITVEVRRAPGVSLFHASDLDLPINRRKKKTRFLPFWHSFCKPLLPIHILGSASLVAYRTRNSVSHIETTFLSKGIVELLPEKCYGSHIYKKQAFHIDSSSLRIASMLEDRLSRFLSRIHLNELSFVKAKIEASITVCFPIELETYIGSEETFQGLLPEWRTKPTVERFWFEMMARVEEKKLKSFTFKMLSPSNIEDTMRWSSLFSNVSFKNVPSPYIRFHSKAPTPDAKW